jgi:hypothetical protein
MMRWVRHVERMREKKSASKTLVGKVKERNQLKDLNMERSIILN